MGGLVCRMEGWGVGFGGPGFRVGGFGGRGCICGARGPPFPLLRHLRTNPPPRAIPPPPAGESRVAAVVKGTDEKAITVGWGGGGRSGAGWGHLGGLGGGGRWGCLRLAQAGAGCKHGGVCGRAQHTAGCSLWSSRGFVAPGSLLLLVAMPTSAPPQPPNPPQPPGRSVQGEAAPHHRVHPGLGQQDLRSGWGGGGSKGGGGRCRAGGACVGRCVEPRAPDDSRSILRNSKSPPPGPSLSQKTKPPKALTAAETPPQKINPKRH